MRKDVCKLANCKPGGRQNLYKIRVNYQFYNLKEKIIIT